MGSADRFRMAVGEVMDVGEGWLNWRELEKLNVWGRKPHTAEELARWDHMVEHWAQRAANDGDAACRQVDLMDIGPEDTVLDVCCGTGPFLPALSRRARWVTCLDASKAMLDHAREKARGLGLRNITFLQGDWFELEPGKDYPVHDVAVTRYSPAQGDLLRFSACASRRCYSVWNCAPADGSEHPLVAIRALAGSPAARRRDPEPDGRLFGYNIHFNLLYDHGADPTLSYAVTRNRRIAGSIDELCQSLFFEELLPDRMERVRDAVAPLTQTLEDGRVCWEHRIKVAVLGWDPGDMLARL